MTRLLNHVRHNAVAYVALFVALGGTGYAAIGLPAGSVGARQLRNGSVMPVKLDRRYMGGYVRAWAHVGADAHLVNSSPGVKVAANGVAPGFSIIDWDQRPDSSCEVIASVSLPAGVSAPSSPGYAVTNLGRVGREKASIVQTFNGQGQPSALPYNAVLICNVPR
jgi:hypothetical protein